MSVPLNTDTRDSYVERMKAEFLHWAEVHHKLGNQNSSWLQLLCYAMAEDIYGEHWDRIKGKNI